MAVLLWGGWQIGGAGVAAAATAYSEATGKDYVVTESTPTSRNFNINADNFPSPPTVYGNISADNGSRIISSYDGTFNPRMVNASGNGYKVTLEEGSYTLRYAYGAYTDTVDAVNNELTIKGGTIAGDIYGGYSASGSANNNTVTIMGSANTDNANVIGGNGTVAANNNTVNILTPVNLHLLYGSQKINSTGNTLNVAVKGSMTGMLGYFQHLNFYLPANIQNGDFMLKVTDAAVFFDSSTTIGAAALSGVNLAVGDKVTLLWTPNHGIYNLDNGALTNTIAGNTSFLAANNLATDTKYTLALTKSDKEIVAEVTSKTADNGSITPGDSDSSGSSGNISDNDRVKSPVETRMASLGLLNSTADMLAGAGFDKASEAVQATREEESKEVGQDGQEGIWMEKPEAANYFVPYAVSNGFNLRHQSGSHVDTKGFGLSIGFSRELVNKNGILLVAPFLEYSRGNYDSYQDNGIHADGMSKAYGLGVMARQTNRNGLYYEGSLRFGRVKADYSSQLSTVTHAAYDSSSNYWAAHLGVGKIVPLKRNNSLNCYLKYFYTHQTGDDVTVKINGGALRDSISFEAVDSHRVRLGARLTHKVDENNSIYGGLAYQYEFKGDGRATYHGESAPSPSVKGSSGMLEVGWQIKPSSRLTMDFVLAGWAGKQRGVTAQLGMNWKF